MAGIKRLEKNNTNIYYIVNEILKPEVKKHLYDDAYGWAELGMIFYDPRTVIYGVFEAGLPTPIGAVYFTNIIPYRDCTLTAVIFNPENRAKGKLKPLYKIIETDMRKMFNIHSCSSYIIGENPASEKSLLALGFEKIGLKKEVAFVDGRYQDVGIYYRLFGG